MTILQMQDACLAYGHIPLLDHADLVIQPRERICLLGRNGAGKSTLLNVIARTQLLDSGRLWWRDGLRLARLEQAVPSALDATLFDVVASGLGELRDLLSRMHAVSLRLAQTDDAQVLQEYSQLQHEVEVADAWTASQRVEAVLDRLSLPSEARLGECSGGLRRRAMLGRALVAEPDLLLLDEPTNHLDIESIQALEEVVADYRGTVLFITHDRTFVDRLATRIIELDRGVVRSYPGNYQAYLDRKALELEAEADASRKFDQTLAGEEVWIRQGIKARRTRNEGRVRRLEALRREHASRLERQGQVRMRTATGEQSGKLVLEAEDVTFSYSDHQLLKPFSTTIMRGDRVGILGRNGSGKTTLLRLLLGELSPTTGDVRQGSRLQLAYFDQERLQLNAEQSVRDSVADGSDHVEQNGKKRHVAGYLADFLFPSSRIHSPVKSLSGGERNRLLLAKLFAKPANLLVLDEPTNDLDVETLELLEELIADYEGTLLLVSHDRHFIDRTVTSLLTIADDGQVKEFPGGYSDWNRHRLAKGATGNQSRSGIEQKVADRAVKTVSARKLSYKEQRELEALPGLIDTLETRQEAVQEKVSSADFYKGSKEQVAQVMKELEDIGAELAKAYARWEALEG